MHDDKRTAARTIVIATLLRLLIAAVLPLGIDESYAVVVSRRLTLSYFDHPPRSSAENPRSRFGGHLSRCLRPRAGCCSGWRRDSSARGLRSGP
jgi:hypothetical protein